MTDIHCHILPGVDDGSAHTAESLMMAELALHSGVDSIIATPHCNLPGNEFSNYRSSELLERFNELNRRLSDARIGLKIYPGAEVFCTDDTPELLREGILLTLAGSRYLLIEFYFNESPDYILDMLRRLTAEGVCPVVAHPERYECIQYDPRTIDSWLKTGCAIQVNKGSVLGRFGSHSRAAADWLLTRGIVHAVGSDAHSPHYRTPDMGHIHYVLSEDYGLDYAELLLETNPNNIINNKELNRI